MASIRSFNATGSCFSVRTRQQTATAAASATPRLFNEESTALLGGWAGRRQWAFHSSRAAPLIVGRRAWPTSSPLRLVVVWTTMSSRRYTNLQPTANGLMRFQTWCLFSGGGEGGQGKKTRHLPQCLLLCCLSLANRLDLVPLPC